MALHLNSDSGTDDYLNKSVAIFSGHTYPLAFTAWVRPDDRGEQYAIASDSGTGTSKQIVIGCSGNGKFQIRQKGGAVASSVHYDNGNTTWFHLTGLFIASNNIKLYVNGSLDGTGTANNNIADFADSNQLYIGTGVYGGSTDITTRTWEGGLAEVAAYTAELSAGEIAALAKGFSPLLVRPSALVGYWPLGGPYAPTTIAPVGNNTLTANGGASAESNPKIIYPMPPPAVMVAAGGQAARAMHHYRMLRCS